MTHSPSIMHLDRYRHKPAHTIATLFYDKLSQHGGLTFLKERAHYERGWIVSNSRYTETVPGDAPYHTLIDAIERFFVKNISVQFSAGIGIWVDPEQDTVYLDVLYHFTEYNSAIKFARKHNQVAFFCLHENRVILTPNPEPPQV